MNYTKLFIISLLFVGAIGDVLSTFMVKPIVKLESSPLSFITGPFGMILIKFILVGFFAWLLYFKLDFFKVDLLKFGFVTFLLILCIVQALAIVNNISVINSIKEHNGYASVSEITESDVKEVTPTNIQKTAALLKWLLVFAYYPLFLSMIAYWCYNNMK